MDRYISNGNVARGQWHQGVAVDLWEFDPKTGTYKKVGVATYDYSVDWTCRCWAMGVFLAPGRVVKTTGMNLVEPATTTSTPQEDIEMYQWLELQRKSPDLFSVLGGRTCRAWSKEAMHKGIDWYKKHDPWDG